MGAQKYHIYSTSSVDHDILYIFVVHTEKVATFEPKLARKFSFGSSLFP